MLIPLLATIYLLSVYLLLSLAQRNTKLTPNLTPTSNPDLSQAVR